MSIPNIISLLRICLVPVFTALYLQGRVMQAMAVLLLCAASDVLDGAIARRFNMVTELGKVLDPVADKLIQAAMMLCAASVTPSVWLLLGMHVLREAALSLLGLHVLRVTGRVYGARWYGKLCTAAIYAVMISLLGFPGRRPAGGGRGRASVRGAGGALPVHVFYELSPHPPGVLRHGELNFTFRPAPRRRL